MRALAVELGEKGIAANATAPGFFLTDMNAAFFAQPRAVELVRRIPLQRFGRPDELVGAAFFLASDAASYITGQVLTVDAGPLGRSVATARLLLEPVRDPTSGQVVGGQLHRDLVAGQDPDAVHSHLARHVGQDLVAIVHLHPEHRVGQRLDHLALHLDCLFLAHGFSFSPFIGVLDGRPMWMRAEMTGGAPNTMALAT